MCRPKSTKFTAVRKKVKNSGTLTPQMISATPNQLVNCVNADWFLASLYKALADCVRVIGVSLKGLVRSHHAGIIEATQRQLQAFAEIRANQVASNPETDKR